MAYSVYFSDEAMADLEQISDYIALDSPVRSLTFFDELENRTVDMLSAFPLTGRKFKDETLYFPIERYVVIYEVNEAGKIVNVLHIVSSRMDWKK